jgi:uncharacterized membrane protein
MRNDKVFKLVATALLGALMIVLALIPNVGFIAVSSVSITLLYIPLMIGAIWLGPKTGLILGAVFGLFSLIVALALGTSPFDKVFTNPLVSVLPRMLAGFIVVYFAKAFRKFTKRLVSVGLAVTLAVLVNALLTVGLMLLFGNWQFYFQAAEYPFPTGFSFFKELFVSVFTINVLIEAIVTVFTTVLVISAIDRYKENHPQGTEVEEVDANNE